MEKDPLHALAESFEYEMRIVSLETGEDQHRGINGWPYDWSRDGRFILYGEGGVDKPRATLNLLPVDGGPIREIMSGDGSTYFNADRKGLRLSPDASTSPFPPERIEPTACFFSRRGRGAIRITQGPFWDMDPIWAPDGRTLLFVSTRSLAASTYGACAFSTARPPGAVRRQARCRPGSIVFSDRERPLALARQELQRTFT